MRYCAASRHVISCHVRNQHYVDLHAFISVFAVPYNRHVPCVTVFVPVIVGSDMHSS